MKKMTICLLALNTLILASCHKADDNGGSAATDFNTLKSTVLTDFTNNVAVTGYLKLSTAAANLNTSINALNDNANQTNLDAAKANWKSMRETWEQCEGFLFGPVEDNDYDPNMDTWPTDYTQMDSLLASSNALSVNDVQNLTLSLRGYHPIEYILFGDHGSRKPGDITARQKKYMISLATDLNNTCNALYLSWVSAPVNYAQTVITAGKGSTKYAKKQEAYLDMLGGMIDICEEVGEGKIKEPFDAKDPQIVESPYSGNSLADFKNNIIGLQNVYMGLNGGKSLKDLVAAKNKSLDNTIQTKITAAVNSFNTVNVTLEQAILDNDQRVKLQQIMTTLGTLKETLDGDLRNFIMTNIQD